MFAANHKKVGVILLSSRQEKDLVLECLQSLQSTEYPTHLLRIVLVDNKSSDDVVAAVRNKFPNVFIIENEKNYGFTAGNNVGIKYCLEYGMDYIVILNNDTVVDKKWLLELIFVAQRSLDIGAVQPKIYLYHDKERINTDGNLIQFLGFAYCGNYMKKDTQIIDEAQREIIYPSGAAMLVKREVFERIGLFEEKLFIYHDDVEFGWRMRLAGYTIYLAPKSHIWHKYKFSKPSNRKFYLMERNRFIVLFENYKLRTLLVLMPASIIMEIGIYFYALTQGWLKEKMLADIYFLNPKNIYRILLARSQKKKLRKVSDKDIVKYFVSGIEFAELQNPLLKYIANPFLAWYWKIVKRIIVW